MLVREKNVISVALVTSDKIILPLLYIKLGLIKQFEKVLNKKGCFDYKRRKF